MMNFSLKKIEDTRKPMKVCVVDNIGGCYLPVAIALSKHFQKVYYHQVNQSPFPRMSISSVGKGYIEIEVIEEFWSNVDNFDIIVFTDIYFSDWGDHLRKMGKKVWGGCKSEILETDRKVFKDELASVGLPVSLTKYIKGLSELKKYLQVVKDKWIKVSYYRGEMETTHHINWNQSTILLDELEYNMGPLSAELEFLVEDPIPSIAEIGTDGWSIDGKMTNGMIWGLEVKDSCYIGKASTYKDLPAPIRDVNNKFSPILAKYNHRGFYSTEIRVGEDGKNYYTDPCVRAGSPPSNAYLDFISNWADIIIAGCDGKLVEPIFKAKYVVELIIKSTLASNKILPMIIPKEYESNVKLRGAFKLNNKTYISPFKWAGYELEEFGSVVVIGDDLTTIMNKAIQIADSIEAPGIRFDKEALGNGTETLQKTEKALSVKF